MTPVDPSTPRLARAHARLASIPPHRLVLLAGLLLVGIGVWRSVEAGDVDRLVGGGALICAMAAVIGRGRGRSW